MTGKQRVAHFIPTFHLAGDPAADHALSAWNELGFAADLIAPTGEMRAAEVREGVCLQQMPFGRRALAVEGWRPRWRRYRAFSCTTEEPAGMAGTLAVLHRRPLVVFATEIGSGAFQSGRPEGWKRQCRWALGKADLAVVNDDSRVEFFREYAHLPLDSPVVVCPNAYSRPPAPANRDEVRLRLGIPRDAFVVGFSGSFFLESGAAWLFGALAALPDIHVVLKSFFLDPLVELLLRETRYRERLHVDLSLQPWQQAWAESVAADVGVAVYLQGRGQFLRMGTSSGKLCMYLGMGVPVIASRQESLVPLERSGAGCLAGSPAEFVEAIGIVRSRKSEMSAKARAAYDDWVAPARRHRDLVAAMAKVL